ncbi:MAG TPA: DUF4386 family protein, partial [Spirochaetia bacterium]|nr:DUF4386 family protein [Spirochaetia bacterium]
MTGSNANLDQDVSWRSFYAAGSIAALAFVILVVVPLVLVFAAPQVPASGGAAVLQYIASHKAVYLAELVCFVGLSVPALVVFCAAGISLKDASRSLAALGALLGVASEIVALSLGSSPQSLNGGLVLLSSQYAAGGDAQRAVLATAAEGIIASTNAVSWAGILTALGILLLSIAMRNGSYPRWVSYLGIVTGILGVPSEAFRPSVGPAYAVYGILLPVWFGAVGWCLLTRARDAGSASSARSDP